jgi:glycosyltransferase 2 family protein
LVVPARWDTVRSKLIEFVQAVRLGALNPRVLMVSLLVGLTFSSMLGELYREYFRANGLGDLPFWRVILVLLSMSIFANVPLSVNGIGLREQLHVLLFAGIGVPREVAVWISLLFFSHTLLVGLAGYILWLRVKPAVVAETP